MPESRLRILTELAVDLGERLRITGNGVAARLGGSLQVLGTLPDQPRLVGTVNILEGTYQAYGQNLRIDKGAAVRFNGPVDNPALDIVAKRPFLPVEVGVSISGTVLNPVITLVSTPDMPDTDKLSWLVLGTDPTNAPSAAQSLALREAARSLLLNDDGRHRPGIAERLGLDVMNFGYGSDTGPAQGITESKNPTGLPGGQGNSSASTTQQEVVTLGKRIGSRLFVSYEQGVRGLYNLLRIQYAAATTRSTCCSRIRSTEDASVDRTLPRSREHLGQRPVESGGILVLHPVPGPRDEAQLAEPRRLPQRRLQLVLHAAVERVLGAPDPGHRAGDPRQRAPDDVGAR
jgi:hypothetical protein